MVAMHGVDDEGKEGRKETAATARQDTDEGRHKDEKCVF
jgi:hypothetical protein